MNFLNLGVIEIEENPKKKRKEKKKKKIEK
jgi:hypothetical protein